MANTKSISAYGDNGHYHLFKLTLTETATSTENNTSTISYVLNLSEKSGYSFDWNGHGSSIKYTITINGTKITGTIPSYTPSTSGTNLKSGTLTISHSSDGSKSISFSFSVTDSTGATYTCGDASASGTMTLTTIPRASVLGKLSTFDVESTLTIPITKYADSYYDVLKVYDENENRLYSYYEIEDGDTFSLTRCGIETLYNVMEKQTHNFTFELSTYSDSDYENLVGISEQVVVGYITDANPVFTDFNVEDSNDTTYALTNNRSTFIKNYSTLKISNIEATALKNATISYWIINDTSYANTGSNEMEFANYSTNSITVYAQDSRNFTTSLTKTLTNFIEYFELIKGTQDINRIEDITEQTNISFKGTFYNGSFGTDGVSNSLEVSYKYKQTKDSDWTNGSTEIIPTINENEYSFEGLISGDTTNGFEISNSYDIKVIVKDKLSEVEYTYQLITGNPAIALFGNKVALGGSYDETKSEYNVQLLNNVYLKNKEIGEFFYPIGSIYLSINDTNPTSLFGGTWKQIAKGRTLVGVDSSDSDFSASQKTGGEKTHTLTTSEMPSHTHTFTGSSATTSSAGAHKHSTQGQWLVPNTSGTVRCVSHQNISGDPTQTNSAIVSAGAHTHTLTAKGTNSSTGGDSAHNNLQPYFTCYIWLRTA